MLVGYVAVASRAKPNNNDKTKNVQCLVLKWNRFESAGAEVLFARLRDHPSLDTIDLSLNSIGSLPQEHIDAQVSSCKA